MIDKGIYEMTDEEMKMLVYICNNAEENICSRDIIDKYDRKVLNFADKIKKASQE